jgi:CheY-like chemotaxis protein
LREGWRPVSVSVKAAMIKILLVEDEERIRSLLKEVLESEGYEIQAASSGKEALQSHARSPPDLILTDIVMPDTEGIEMIMKIRKSDPNVKIVAMSGGDYLDMAKKLGADCTLTKPFSNQALLDAVKATLET